MDFGDLASIAILLTMAAMSWRADRRLQHMDRLPMQWGLDGKPTWYAPRRLAVSLLPLVAACILALITLAHHQAGAEGSAAAIAPRLVTGLSFIAIHWFHLHLAGAHGR